MNSELDTDEILPMGDHTGDDIAPDRELLDRVEGEIAKVEATLAQLSDPGTDAAAVTSWLPSP